MKRLLSLLILVSVSLSCKVQYASFQESSGPKHNSGLHKKLRPGTFKSPTKKNLDLAQKEVSFPERLSFDKKIIPVLISPERTERKVYHFGPSIDDIDLSGEEQEVSTNLLLTKQKKGKKFRQVSSNMFLGILFLVIAGVLGYLNLLSLAILFALASIIFLILAIKQLWKTRGKKKKKENRKKFFKDLFS